MREIEEKVQLRVSLDRRLCLTLRAIARAQDMRLDHLVESILLLALAGQEVFPLHRQEVLELSRLVGWDLRALAQERISEGILTPEKPREKRARRVAPRATSSASAESSPGVD